MFHVLLRIFLECDTGWICYFSTCLKISTQPLSWSEADEVCSKQEAHLWSIDTEDVALKDYLDYSYRSTAFFIGLVSSPIARGVYSYRWSDESPFVYSNWDQLNARSEGHLCTTIIPDRKATGSIIDWKSVRCSSTNGFICEKSKSEAGLFSQFNFDAYNFFQFSELMTVDLQLINGVTPNRGRLEIFLEGAWRRVSMAKSGVNVSQTAVAVCRYFGYPDVLFTRALNRSEEGNNGNNAFSLDCLWKKNTISCSYERVTCDSDLFISCQSIRRYSPEVRLANGSLPSQGFLQILWIDGSWRIVCVIYSDINLFCKHLGYSRGRKIEGFVSDPSSKSFYSYCDFSASTLEDCIFFETSCAVSWTIECSNAEWQVRLFNTEDTTRETEGNVEVFYKDTRTVVCGGERSKWDLAGADVVCRQLGFAKASSAYSERLELTPRRLNQNYSFLTVACNGSESSLQDCKHMLPQNRSCGKAVAVCKKNKCEPCSF